MQLEASLNRGVSAQVQAPGKECPGWQEGALRRGWPQSGHNPGRDGGCKAGGTEGRAGFKVEAMLGNHHKL